MRIFLALGSNIGDREQYLRSAAKGLAGRGIQLSRTASIYSTEPRDVLDQRWFLNTVIEADTSLEPEELLARCLAVELENHRKRETNKGPRTLDIDLILYGSEIVRKPGLSIPHPQFADRRFVLEPLAEIAADFIDPVSGRKVHELLESCGDHAAVNRVGPPLDLH